MENTKKDIEDQFETLIKEEPQKTEEYQQGTEGRLEN